MKRIARLALLTLIPIGAIACSNEAAGPGDARSDGGSGGNTAQGSGGRTGAAGSPGTGGTQGPTGSGGGSGGGVGSGGGIGTGGAFAGSGGADAGAGRTDGGADAATGGSQGGRDAGAGGTAGGSGGMTGGMTGGVGGAGFNPCPASGACAVLPLGDSITEGFLPTGDNGGYRVEMFRQAVLAGKNLTFVGSLTNGPSTVQNRPFPPRHEGHGGFTIAGGGVGAIAGPVTDTAISTYHPNIVLLMIGTNDINGNINVANAPTRLGQLMDEIIADAPTAFVAVATIIPIASNTSQAVQTYNAAIPNLVNARAASGKHVGLVDNYAAFVKDASFRTSLMVDNLHPNEAGYAVLGGAFYGAVSGLLRPGP